MNTAKLFKFSALMFFAAAVYLFLTAATQAESRLLYIAIAVFCVAAGVLASAKSGSVKGKQ